MSRSSSGGWLVGALALLAPSFSSAEGPSPVVIAHRGASGYLPEHTTEALVLAHAQGADFIEQDLVLTKDRVLVVLHDVQLDAVTDVAKRFPDRHREDGRWYALDFTLAEIKTLNVHERSGRGGASSSSSKRFPVDKGAFRVPTFDEELELIAGLNATTGRRVGIYPEIKSPAWHREQNADLSPIVLEALARHGYKGKDDLCFLQCFDFAEVKRIREDLKYQGRLVQLLGGRRGPDGADATSPEGLEALAKVVDGIGPALPLVVRSEGGKLVPTDLVRFAHERGLVVHPYTLRADAVPPGAADAEAFFRAVLCDAQVDGAFTDHPDVAVRALKTRP